MATPAIAAKLVEVCSLEELKSALRFVQQAGMSALPLGEGSNTVFQRDYNGLVVLVRIGGINLVQENEQSATIQVGAGVNWHKLVAHCLQQGWYGLENLALIPGLAGAAPIQNIGAYGVEIASFISRVEVLNIATLEVSTLANQECVFGYRDSIFKHALKDQVVITQVELCLNKEAQPNIAYPALKNYFGSRQPMPEQVFNAVCEIRNAKLPLPSDIPNCGSFFKNPVVSETEFVSLKQRFPHIVGFRFGDQVKLAAAWLIEQAGWKDQSYKDVCVHKEQALVITNARHRRGETVVHFAQMIQQDISDKFGVELEIEPQII